MEAAYGVMADCLGLTAAREADRSSPWYDTSGEVWYPFPKYSSVAEVRSAVDTAFTPEGGAFLHTCLDPAGDPWLMDREGALWWRESAYMDGAVFLPPAYYAFDSLVLLSREEDRLELALLGLGNYRDVPLERFVLVGGEGAWRLETYGAQTAPLEGSLPGSLWAHTWSLLPEDLHAAVEEARVEDAVRWPDQEGPEGEVLRIYRFSPVYTLSQPPAQLPDGYVLSGLSLRPDSAPWLVFLVQGEEQVCLGTIPGGGDGPDGPVFTAERDLLLARWRADSGASA